MSNQLEKLKKSINKECTKKFELNLMKTSGFIPVDKRQNDIFVIIDKTKLAEQKNVEKVKANLRQTWSDLLHVEMRKRTNEKRSIKTQEGRTF